MPFRPSIRRALAAAAVAASLGVTALASPALAQSGVGAPPPTHPSPVPCAPLTVGSHCPVTTSVTFSHLTSRMVWAVGNFPNQTQVLENVAYAIACSDGSHGSISLDAFLPAPNPFGANWAANGGIILPAQAQRATWVTCTMSQTIRWGWTTTANPGADVADNSDFVRFDNV